MIFLFLILGIIVFVFIVGAIIAFLPSKTLQELEESIFGKKNKNAEQTQENSQSDTDSHQKIP